MLWVRNTPLFEGNLFDLTLRDLLDLDLYLASLKSPAYRNPKYKGGVRHWWQMPAAIEDYNTCEVDKIHHPDAFLILLVRVWGSYRASGRSDSLDSILDSDLAWDEVLVVPDAAEVVEDEGLPHGFRAGNVQRPSMPDVEGMDVRREVSQRLLVVARLFGWTLDEVYQLPLYAWLGVSALVDSLEG